MDLELARADRRLDAVPVPPASASAWATADSGVPKKRSETLARRCALEDPVARAPSRARAATAAAAPAAVPAGSRPRRAVRLSTRPGAVPARPSEMPPSGSVACLRTPVVKSVYGLPGAPRSSARRPRSHARAPRRGRARRPHARDHLDGTVVVRRPEARRRRGRDRRRSPRESAARDPPDGRRRSRSARDRGRVARPPRRGTARSGPAGRRGRARCPSRRSPPEGARQEVADDAPRGDDERRARRQAHAVRR